MNSLENHLDSDISDVWETLLLSGYIQALQSLKQKSLHCAQYRARTNALDCLILCRFLERNSSLRGATRGMLSAADLCQQRQKHSSLSYFSSCYPMCCFVRTLTKRPDPYLSCPSSPVSILLCLLQQFDAADEEKQEQNMWRTGGDNLALAIKICQVLRQKLHAVSLIF